MHGYLTYSPFSELQCILEPDLLSVNSYILCSVILWDLPTT